ncbi:hypothetical protein M426DRAFT_266434 [Hypoxylon sp. CI-4A]|nr:hypothetical protein M426DRAFT_266434 [Hypoxylon sp. CI-4A]
MAREKSGTAKKNRPKRETWVIFIEEDGNSLLSTGNEGRSVGQNCSTNLTIQIPNITYSYQKMIMDRESYLLFGVLVPKSDLKKEPTPLAPKGAPATLAPRKASDYPRFKTPTPPIPKKAPIPPDPNQLPPYPGYTIVPAPPRPRKASTPPGLSPPSSSASSVYVTAFSQLASSILITYRARPRRDGSAGEGGCGG